MDKQIADIKDIAAVFERGLHIQLGDLYRAFIEIQIRKKERTKFLDTLKDNLIQRMNEADSYCVSSTRKE